MAKGVIGIGLVLFAATAGQAIAQSAQNLGLATAASNIAPANTAPTIAPSAPSDDQARIFLQAAHDALEHGHTGEMQDALERAESRLRDTSIDLVRFASPNIAQAVMDIGVARQDLAEQDRPGVARAIDDALFAIGQSALPSSPATVTDPSTAVIQLPTPTFTHALLPGHWQLNGAKWVWIPPDKILRPVTVRTFVPGENVWRDGKWTWVPAHYAD